MHPDVSFASALDEYLLHDRNVISARVEPCPLGAAFVSFDSW